MNPGSLENIGLTEGESKVYLALLRMRVSTIGNIIKEARVSNSKVYNILDRLSKKGLVGTVIIKNKRHFEAKDPSRLKEFIKLEEFLYSSSLSVEFLSNSILNASLVGRLLYFTTKLLIISKTNRSVLS